MWSEAFRRRPWLRTWLVLCASIAVGSGIAALNWLDIAASINRSDGGTDTSYFWNAYLRFHYWAFLSYFALLLGLVSAGVVSLLAARHR